MKIEFHELFTAPNGEQWYVCPQFQNIHQVACTETEKTDHLCWHCRVPLTVENKVESERMVVA